WHHQRGEFPLRISISELPSQKDEVKRFIASVQDLTQIKSHEEQIRRTQKMDALGKLTGGIAHDYNNMLAVISGYANLLAEQLQEEHHKKYAIEIAKAGERGAKLTRRLLSFSKRTSTSNELCNLTDILTQMSDMLEKTLTARIQLVYKLDQTLLKTRLNSGDLEDAVLNLCINAMHAIEGNGRIEIHTSQLNLGYGEYVELRIIDNGCGMDEATCEKIFDPFFSTKGDKGTGLGLSQVYSFVERSQGSIEVESKLGIGTEVIMRFPIEHEPHLDTNLDDNSGNKDLKLHGRVLVVDDERQIRDYLTIVLENVALNVRTANNGKEALEILAKEQFDIVLSDVIMPEMNGIELAKEIQRLYPEVKIQLATGFANDVELNKLEDNIAASIITKPYKSNTIIQRMAELLA
ncbi:MAG: response regulator, partial [Gammaproteobacteria bacterium]|nr:response regulator [Gammaproteobacteria bacterium]